MKLKGRNLLRCCYCCCVCASVCEREAGRRGSQPLQTVKKGKKNISVIKSDNSTTAYGAQKFAEK